MFYIIEHEYVGPNTGQHIDDHIVVITTEPAQTNMSHEDRTEGWCGTTNDWALHAHGEHETEDAARAAITATFGECREIMDPAALDDDEIATFRVGKYEPLCAQATREWLYDGMRDSIDADTTDEQIAQQATDYEIDANAQGYTLLSPETVLEEYRDELRDDQE